MIKNIKTVPVLGLGALVASAIFAVAPVNADSCPATASGSGTLTASCDVEVRVTVNDYIDFRTVYYDNLADKTSYNAANDTDLHPTTTVTNGNTDETQTSRFLVSTNYVKGYNLTVEDADDSNALESAEGKTIAAGTTLSGNNSAWAIKAAKTQNTSWLKTGSGYFVVPVTKTSSGTSNGASATTIVQSSALTSTAIVDDDLTITYGVYVSGNQPAGTYFDTITYSATVNP